MAVVNKSYGKSTVEQNKVYRRFGQVNNPFVPEHSNLLTYTFERCDPDGDRYPNGAPVMSANDSQHKAWIKANPVDSCDQAARAAFRNQASNRVQDGASASLGIGIAQWEKSLDMIANRSNQLRGFFKKLPGLNLALAAEDLYYRRKWLKMLGKRLSVPSNSKELRNMNRWRANEWRNRIRTPGDLFLEFWFGWSPLVKDIYTACDTLQRPIPGNAVTVRARSTTEYEKWWGLPFPPSGTYNVSMCAGQVSVGYFGRVSVVNPNLYLANKLGLVNPASIVLDAIPFSWLLNWFANVQQFVGSLSWDAGLSLITASLGRGVRYSYTAKRYWYYKPTSPNHLVGSARGVFRYREKASDVQPKLRFHPPQGSAARAAVAVSLLLQHLSKF